MSSPGVGCLARRLRPLRVPGRPPILGPTLGPAPGAGPRPQRRPFALSAPARSDGSRRGRKKPSSAGHGARPRASPGLTPFLAAGGLLTCAYLLVSPAPLRASFVVETPPAAAAAAAGVSRAPAAAKSAGSASADTRDPSLPRFRIAEVRKHGPDSEQPWVMHGDKVYDITEWVPAHPGGQVILRAAGGSIDAYWDIFTIHKDPYVYEILSHYLIGLVDQADLVDGKPAREQIEDPFADDPARHPALVVRTARPCNAETPGEALVAQFLTPNELFYVRNHMWVPRVDEAASDGHLLTVELLDGTVKRYTLHDLKTRFRSRKVTAVLQCSGNRRRHMTQGSGRATNGLQWAAGAISNASWEGVLLADVLADAGLDVAQALGGASAAKHVHLAGMEAYGASIPLRKAVDPQGDVLLAYAMNDAPLPRDHGFPLRAIVPGHVAARSVKWLSQITLSDEESASQWQRRDYKCFGPNETKVDWDAAPAIQEMPVQSAITAVRMGGWIGGSDGGQQESTRAAQPAREVSLAGYAFSGGGRSIIRVDVSLDGGRSWAQARLLPDCDAVAPAAAADGQSPPPCHGNGAWSWKRWRLDGAVPLGAFLERELRREYPADVKPEKEEPAASTARGDDGDENDGGVDGSGNGNAAAAGGEADAGRGPRRRPRRRCTTVLVKATDDAYNTQPESHAATWNLRGNLATAWHRIQVCADCSAPAAASPPERAAGGGDGGGGGA